MKKSVFFILASLPFLIYAQSPMHPVLKNYFRTHPFDIRFSSFIISLQQDPGFTVSELKRRTDSTFFFLSGTYINFNPFGYKAKEVRLIVAEQEFIHADSLQTLDTIINIQLLGITDTSISNLSITEKEYNRFFRKYASGFWKNTYAKSQLGNKVAGEASNLFIYPFSISPVTVAWGRMPITKEFTFTITIRCKVKQNTADLILTPDGL
jgi:hypothetical protein